MNNDFSLLLHGFKEEEKNELEKLFSAEINHHVQIFDAQNNNFEQILQTEPINLLIHSTGNGESLAAFLDSSTRLKPFVPVMVYHLKPLDESQLQAINKRQDNIILLSRKKDLLKSVKNIYNKQPEEITGIVKDCDAEKALEIIGDVVWDWDINNDTVMFSDSVRIMLQIPENEMKKAHSKMGRIHPEDRIHVQGRIKKHLSGETTLFESEYRILKGEKEYIWVLDRGRIIRHSKDGMPSRAIGTLSEISFRKKYEDSLRNAKLNAEEGGRLKTFYLTSMHDKISSPVSAVMGYAEAMTDELMSPEQRAFISKKVLSSSEGILQSINDILDISKLDTGSINPHFSSKNVSKVLNDVIAATEQKLTKYGRDNLGLILDETPEDFPLATDHSLLRQVLMHIMDNAVKFTPQGEVHIGYTICNNKTLCIYVKDLGIGMDSENIEKIFDKFKRLPNAKDINFSGNGLGLPIARGFAHSLGGEIYVESTYGKGSTFTIHLPFYGSEGRIFKTQVQETAVDWSQYHIMMVEDDNVSASLIKTQLESTKVNLTILNNPIIAINRIKEGKVPDLILMDIQLPGISGLEATKIIKSNNPDVTIIAQTAFTMQSDRKKVWRPDVQIICLNLLKRKN